MDAKMTPWLPPHVSPVRNGLYRVAVRSQFGNSNPQVKWALWRGGEWKLALSSPQRAAVSRIRSTDCYSARFQGWCGLAAPAGSQEPTP